MYEIPERLETFLREQHTSYEMIEHRPDYTSEQAAADTHTPAREFAKTVVLRIGGQYAMAVLPAHHHVDLEALRSALGKGDVDLATEEEIAAILPDCEVGAIPPLGRLYELPVYVSPKLSERDRVTFSGGTHHTAIRMAQRDFERLVGGTVIDFSVPPLVEGA